jgi:hypothetical protein
LTDKDEAIKYCNNTVKKRLQNTDNYIKDAYIYSLVKNNIIDLLKIIDKLDGILDLDLNLKIGQKIIYSDFDSFRWDGKYVIREKEYNSIDTCGNLKFSQIIYKAQKIRSDKPEDFVNFSLNRGYASSWKFIQDDNISRPNAILPEILQEWSKY